MARTISKWSDSASQSDREYGSWAPTANDDVARRTIVDGRSSTPTVAEIFSMFNPLSMPLRPWTRIFELHEPVGEFERGLYFINETFIQYVIRVNSTYPAFDTEIVENNIFLLDINTALELDATSDSDPVPTIGVFLELE